MTYESPQIHNGNGSQISGIGGPADLSADSELGFGDENPVPAGYENLHRGAILRIVKLSARPGTPFPIPDELKQWGVTELGLIIADPKKSPRQKATAVRALAALERVNQTARALDEGIPVNLTAQIPPQAIQAAVEAYFLGTNPIHPGANGKGPGPSIARLVGGGGDAGSGGTVPDASAHHGHGSNGHGTSAGRNGNGYPDN